MLLVGPVVPVLPVTGVMITGNDAGKALRLQAYYEATDSGRTLFAVRLRECKRNGCDGRCLDGRAFGRGFDSRQVHMTKVRFGQVLPGKSDFFYSSSRNIRDFSREIRAQSDSCLHREYNLAMRNKSLLRIADVRSGRRLRAAHVAARTQRRS